MPRFQFSLSRLLIFTGLVATALALLEFSRRPASIVQRIEAVGGRVEVERNWVTSLQPFLGRFRRFETVWMVAVGSDEITDHDLKRVSKLRSVSGIIVRSRSVSDEGLLSLKSLPRLDFLSIGSPNLTDKGVAAACSPQLTDLSVYSDNITGSFLSSFRPRFLPSDHEATPSQLRLGSIAIHSAAFADEGSREIALLPNVRVVELSDCSISDTALEVFATIKTLKRLDVSGTRITGSALDAFHNARPEVRIVADHLSDHPYARRVIP